MARSMTALLLAAVLSACTSFAPQRSAPPPERSAAVPDRALSLNPAEANASRQILVTVRQEGSMALGLVGGPGGDPNLSGRRYDPEPRIDRLMNQLAREYGIRRVSGWPVESLRAYCEVFEAEPGRDLARLLSDLDGDPRVTLAQPMNIFETQGYNDKYSTLQTSVVRLEVEPVHQVATGQGVTVALIDSQVDWRHPDLRGRVRLTRDFVGGGVSRAPAEIHGTAVAGVIASIANNTEGIVGVAPGVELEALRACWGVDDSSSAARCSSFSLAQALDSALVLEPDVINMSLSGPDDPLLARLLDVAISRGIVVVASIPESDRPGMGFPASHPGVIGARSELSRAGAPHALLLSAPGVEILTTIPRAGYAFFSGNSFAAANVSGVIALLLEEDPRISAVEIVRLLAETTIEDGVAQSINACRAVARLAHADLCYDSQTIALEAR